MPRPMPAPRRAPALLALAAAAASLLAPSPAGAQLAEPAVWRVGPAFGFESGDVGGESYSAPKLRVDFERSLRTLSPKASVGLVVSLGAFHPSGSYDVAIPVGYYPYFEAVSVTWNANVFEAVAAARVLYELSPRMSLFGDGGLGVNHVVSRATLPPELTSLGADSVVGDGTGGVVRVAGGFVWTPGPDVRVGFELVGLQLRFGDGAETGFNMLVSFSHRL